MAYTNFRVGDRILAPHDRIDISKKRTAYDLYPATVLEVRGVDSYIIEFDGIKGNRDENLPNERQRWYFDSDWGVHLAMYILPSNLKDAVKLILQGGSTPTNLKELVQKHFQA